MFVFRDKLIIYLLERERSSIPTTTMASEQQSEPVLKAPALDFTAFFQAAKERKDALPSSFVPTNWSVVCGRGPKVFNHGKFQLDPKIQTLLSSLRKRASQRYQLETNVSEFSVNLQKIGTIELHRKLKDLSS